MSQQMHPLIAQAQQYFQSGNLEGAEVLLARVLQEQPRNFQVLNILGVIYSNQGKFADSVKTLQKALKLAPNHPVINYNLANVFLMQGEHQKAIPYHMKAVKLDPDNYWVNVNYGISLSRTGNFKQALQYFRKAIAVNQDIPQAWANLGNACREMKHFAEALIHYDRALELDPDYADAWYNKGVALYEGRRSDEAIAHYDRAVQLNPDFVEAWSSKGAVLDELKRHDEALAHFDRALQLNPAYAQAWFNKGLTLTGLRRQEDALAHFVKAHELNPAIDFLLGFRVFTQMLLCDWSDFDANLAMLSRKIRNHEKIIAPFSLLPLLDDPQLQLQAARTWSKAKYTLGTDAAPKFRHEKIRIGYFSPDFRMHAVSFLMAEVFELHDRNRFEIFAFSLEKADENDAMRKRLSRAFDRFIDVDDKSDAEIAQIARELEIDIAIDLAGHTRNSRPEIFAQRAASVQVNYLGYPGTMGAEFIDYIIADSNLIAEADRVCYSEKIIRLPDCFQPNDTQKIISDRKFSREELGLPAEGFIFCCFNNNYKITPKVFDGWARILKKVDHSCLWLLAETPTVENNLRKEIARRGVDPTRLVFGGRLEPAEYLARYRVADLFLDTLPFNAGTTASDALWTGLPVLTCRGKSFAGRMAASLLKAIDVPELITHKQEDYEARAIELATNPEMLAAIRRKLAANRLGAPIFDTRRYVHNLEAAYLAILNQPPGAAASQ